MTNWLLCALFALYDVLLRVFPNVMVGPLTEHYHLSATQLGNLSAAFLWAYALMSLPAGWMIDRLGIHRCAPVAVLLCMLATLVFFSTRDVTIAYIARFMMGAGGVFGFLSAMKVIFQQMPARQKGLFTGLTIAISALGAMLCNSVLVQFANYHNWAWFVGIVIGIGLVLAILMAFGLKPCGRFERSTGSKPQVGIMNRALPLLFLGLLSGLIYLPFALWQDLWGTPFIQVVANLSQANAAQWVSVIWLGWGIGAIVVGRLSDRFGIMRILALMLLLEYITFAVLIHGPWLQHRFWILPAAFLLGLSTASMLLCYLWAERLVPKTQALSTAWVNTSVTVMVCLALPTMGYLIDQSTIKQPHLLDISALVFVHIMDHVLLILLGTWLLWGLLAWYWPSRDWVCFKPAPQPAPNFC